VDADYLKEPPSESVMCGLPFMRSGCPRVSHLDERTFDAVLLTRAPDSQGLVRRLRPGIKRLQFPLSYLPALPMKRPRCRP
jgi:hypothetical protein